MTDSFRKGTFPRSFWRLQFSLLVLSLAGLTQRASAAGFSITDIGTLGGSYSLGYGINNSGAVTGESETTNTLTHGFLYRSGTNSDLSAFAFGQVYSSGHGINNSNEVVGQAAIGGFCRAFLVSGTNRSDVGTLGGDYSDGYGINDAGQIVGESTLSQANGGLTHAFLKTGATMSDIGTLGGNYSSARAVNKFGHVVGEANTTNNVTHAFYYDGSRMTDLGTFGGQESSASAINDSDEVVGYAVTASGFAHAFTYTNGVLSDLGTLGGEESAANGVNNKGQVVGYYTIVSGTTTNTHAFYCDGKTMYDLNDLIPSNSGWSELTSAQSISDSGEITGYGQINGQTHAFLIAPVLLSFRSPQILANGSFEVTVDGVAGQNWQIEGSTDLTNWTLLQTVTLGPVSFTDTNATKFGFRFDRGVLAP